MINKQREFLVESLQCVSCSAESCSATDCGRCGDLDKLDRCQIEAIADYLLANGVIVPPDELYNIVDKGTIYATVTKAMIDWLPLYVIKDPEKYGYYLTKEEAGKALVNYGSSKNDIERKED